MLAYYRAGGAARDGVSGGKEGCQEGPRRGRGYRARKDRGRGAGKRFLRCVTPVDVMLGRMSGMGENGEGYMTAFPREDGEGKARAIMGL